MDYFIKGKKLEDCSYPELSQDLKRLRDMLKDRPINEAGNIPEILMCVDSELKKRDSEVPFRSTPLRNYKPELDNAFMRGAKWWRDIVQPCIDKGI